MAQWEREEISERISASVPIRAKMGKPLGGAAPFGYTWKDKQLYIDEKEAVVCKLMYEIFLKTKRIKTTAHELNKLGHRTRNSAKFTGTTVERLLLDPIAKGERIANYSKSTGAGKKWVTKPESEWIKLSCPAIISEEIWAECNSILQNRVVTKKAIGPRPIYLFAGFVFCNCGKKMIARNQNPVYKCASCNVKIGTMDLEEIYHEQLK